MYKPNKTNNLFCVCHCVFRIFSLPPSPIIPSTTNNTTATSTTIITTANITSSSIDNPFVLQSPMPIIATTLKPNLEINTAIESHILAPTLNSFTNPFVSTTTITATTLQQQIINDKLQLHDYVDAKVIIPNTNGNIYQPLSRPAPVLHPHDPLYVENQLASKMNRLYQQSPLLPRKNYEFASGNNISPSPSPLHQIGKN